MPERWAGRRFNCVAAVGGIVVSTIIDLFNWGQISSWSFQPPMDLKPIDGFSHFSWRHAGGGLAAHIAFALALGPGKGFLHRLALREPDAHLGQDRLRVDLLRDLGRSR